jgi:N-acetylglucosaminyldiphosphoundecaprenol N-acetyl-beta-D-mannosaminyltransferase
MTVLDHQGKPPAPAAKLSVVGVGVNPTSYEEATAVCGHWVEERRTALQQGREIPGRCVAITDVHVIMTAVSRPDVLQVLNDADMVTPDGMPVVWALRSFGRHDQQRVYGPTLMLHVCRQAARFGHRVFLYGGLPETLPTLINNLKSQAPGLRVVGSYSPPFRELTPEEDAEVVRSIRESDADILFVGVSSPKQQLWIADHKHKLPGVVMLGVGAAFDFHSGRVEQAPAWMQRSGLEWFFRLTREPGRLWRRYVLKTPRFLPLWAMQWAGIKKFSIDGETPGSR